MALLNLVQVRENIETGLGDDALQRIMDAVEEDIDQRHGAVDSQVDDLEAGLEKLWTTRPILTITTVTETVGTTDTDLSANDFVKRHETQLDRLNTGDNSRERWGIRVKITYVPVDTTKRRITTFLKMILMDIVYSGLDSSREGDFNSKSLNYASEREKLLSSLDRPGTFI